MKNVNVTTRKDSKTLSIIIMKVQVLQSIVKTNEADQQLC